MFKKDDKKVNKKSKGQGTLSILEKGLYTKDKKYKPINHSIMELKVYNSTVHRRKWLWQRMKAIWGNTLEEDF